MLAGKRVLQVLQQIITRDYSLSHKSELAKQPFYIHKYYPSVYFAVCTYNFWILALRNQYCVFNGSRNDQYIYIYTLYIAE